MARANTYLECISGEAGDDLDVYYQAVTSEFNEKQSGVLGTIETMRIDLELDEDPNPDPQSIRDDIEDQLVAPEVPSEVADEAGSLLETVRGPQSQSSDLSMEPVGN